MTDLSAVGLPVPVPANASEPPPIWFATTDGFYQLPIANTPEERAERAQLFVRALYSRGDESIWEPAAEYYAALAEAMARGGASYAAMGLFSTADADGALEGTAAEDGHEPSLGVAQCALTLAIVPTERHPDDPSKAAGKILEALSRDELNDVRPLDLLCGPAVSCISMTEYRLNPEITATGEEAKLLTGQIQVHIPFPTGPFTAVFTLDTASLDYWAEFCEVMMSILRAVSFEVPVIEFVDGDDSPGADAKPS
ncbi:hypothetical protein [Streptomyces sp. NPDC002851]